MITSYLLKYLPKNLSHILSCYDSFENSEELRLRSGKKAIFFAEGREFVTEYITKKIEIEQAVAALAEHSLYSVREDIAKGFFTVRGGVRIGVGGKAVTAGGRIVQIRDFTSLNIRFPREYRGSGTGVLPYILKSGAPANTIILSPPQFGKTTLLRDVVRILSSGENCMPRKCAVVDERGEISGGGSFDVGDRTDVLLDCPKAEGMAMALRALSPEVIATDEIGGDGDLAAIREMANCGIKLLATAHARDMTELSSRLFFRELMETGVIERVIVLSGALGRGTVQAVLDGKWKNMLQKPFLARSAEGESR